VVTERADPVAYSEEIADRICEEIAMGKALRQICRAEKGHQGGEGLEGMPSRWAVKNWLYKYPEFEVKYRNACRFRADSMMDEIMEIADDASLDVEKRVDKNGNEYDWVNFDNIARSRLMVDTRKWAMSKYHAARYGDKIAVGGDPNAPAIRHAIEFVIVDPADPAPDSGSEEA
jgi:hypothetical protein